MRSILTRREWVAYIPLAGAALALGRVNAAGAQPPTPSAPSDATGIADSFPAQDPAMAREMVGVSHGNLERAAALLKAAPQLANATYDWGFGDWETALGAASHTGRRQIAALLLENGARPDIFACAMLGQVEAVKAMIAARPGLQRMRGPHGLTLLHHAKAGGEASAAVAEYLATLGDADVPYRDLPLAPQERAAYVGVYAYGPAQSQRFQVLVPEKQERLSIQRGTGFARGLFHLGDHTFHPVGAPDVRLAFTVEGDKAVRVAVSTPATLLSAERV